MYSLCIHLLCLYFCCLHLLANMYSVTHNSHVHMTVSQSRSTLAWPVTIFEYMYICLLYKYLHEFKHTHKRVVDIPAPLQQAPAVGDWHQRTTPPMYLHPLAWCKLTVSRTKASVLGLAALCKVRAANRVFEAHARESFGSVCGRLGH